MKSAQENIANLPAICATRLLSNNEPIIIKAGETGYYPAPQLEVVGDDFDNAFIDLFNKAAGASRAQIAAMEAGSMWGYGIGGADPDNYTADGKIIPIAERK